MRQPRSPGPTDGDGDDRRPENDPGPGDLRRLTVPALLWRGATRRCPVCGGGDLLLRWTRVRDRCPRCNFPIDERIEGHWMGSLGLNVIVSFGLLLVTLAVGIALTMPDIRTVPLIVAGGVVSTVVPVLFLPYSKTLWSAIDLAMRPLEPDDEVDPRWIPPGR
jgi:uncharacterized protein (DUF983 family)